MNSVTPRFRLIVGLLALVVVALVSIWRGAPSTPLSAGAPEAVFSEARARAALSRVLGGGKPHPVGSEEAAAVRKRLVEEIESLGLVADIRESFACSPDGVCAPVTNVVTAVPGRESGPGVLIVCHYDSVGAGPGAADDGSGVAVLLEVARALRQSPPPRHPVLFLFDEAEEAGLLGAWAFLEQKDWSRQVAVVVNLEARGTAGPSLIFETAGDDLWLAPHIAASPRPYTSSLFVSIYERMPNDTDLTAFKARGFPGINIAFIGEPRHYHTPLDDLSHLSPATLQQHGDNALALVRSLAGGDLTNRRSGNAVFFDLLSLFVLRWPDRYSLPLAVVSVLFLAIALSLHWRSGDGSVRRMAWSMLSLLAALALSLLLTIGALLALRALSFGARQWVAHDTLLMTLAWVAAVAGVTLAAPIQRRGGPYCAWAATWLLWAMVGVVMTLLMSGRAAYPFVLPALVAACTSIAARLLPALKEWLALPPAVAAGLLVLPLARLFPDALGVLALPIVTALGTALLWMMLPLGGLQQRFRWISLPSLALFAILAGLSAWLPADTPQRPGRLTLRLAVDADTDRARLLAASESGSLPQAWQSAGFAAQAEPAFPWWSRPVFAAPATAPQWRPPVLEGLSVERVSSKVRVRARLRSPRGAVDGFVILPPSTRIEHVHIGGRPLPPHSRPKQDSSSKRWKTLACLALPADGVEIEWTMEGTEAVEAVIADRSQGVPGAEGLIRSRPAWCVPSQDGDSSIVYRRVRVDPSATPPQWGLETEASRDGAYAGPPLSADR